MADRSPNDESRTIEPNSLYVGEGVTLKGDISNSHIIVVDGSIEGNVVGHAIWVGPSGTIKGTIVASEAEIHGTISEKIEVKQLLLVHPTGRVTGEVSYGDLVLLKGAVISGTFAPKNAQSENKEPTLEQILGKSERPAILNLVGPLRPFNIARQQTKLPAADFRVAS